MSYDTQNQIDEACFKCLLPKRYCTCLFRTWPRPVDVSPVIPMTPDSGNVIPMTNEDGRVTPMIVQRIVWPRNEHE